MQYDYLCTNCDSEFEIEQSVKDPIKKKCPLCEKYSLERVLNAAPLGFVRGEVTTVGQAVEKNEKRMGKYGLEDARHNQKEELDKNREKARQALQEKLPGNIKLAKPGKNVFGELPKNVKNAVNSGDSKRIEKYIHEGK